MTNVYRLCLRATARSVRDVIDSDITRSYKQIRKLDFDREFGKLIFLTTRVKVMKMFLELLNLLDEDKYLEASSKLYFLHKRININLCQIKKLNKNKYEPLRTYYEDFVHVIYKYIHSLRKLRTTNRASPSIPDVTT